MLLFGCKNARFEDLDSTRASDVPNCLDAVSPIASSIGALLVPHYLGQLLLSVKC